ncbi:4-oxalocrotonate decarboxylase [Mycobacteroides abscessus subsp. abscessus]|nr:4-oxalocrotonate decarboxylase [Mycobacteroides abscessus subsp. abscessus]
MGRRLAGPGVSAATALAAVDHVLGAIEIIDSRFSGYRFSMMDAVADNNSSGRYVTGPIARRPEDLDLALEACLLEVDGEVVDSATGAAVHGHPAEALAFAANIRSPWRAVEMPIIEVTIAAGRDPRQLRQLIHELTAAAQRALDAPLPTIRVILRETPPTHFAAGDVTLAERQGRT